MRFRIAGLTALALLTAACQAGNPPPRNTLVLANLWLDIKVTGRFEDLVLRDPRGRVNLIKPSGAESTFAGCVRFDFPDQFGIAEGDDYARFQIRGPIAGRYRLVLRARETGQPWVAVHGAWEGGGSTDAAWPQLHQGDEVSIVVRMTPDRRSKVGAFTVKIESPVVRRPRR